MDLEEILRISEELNVDFSTINNSSQEPLEAETDEECVRSNLALDFDTSHTDREEALKESPVRSHARLRITLTQRATNSTFHAGVSSPD